MDGRLPSPRHSLYQTGRWQRRRRFLREEESPKDCGEPMMEEESHAGDGAGDDEGALRLLRRVRAARAQLIVGEV